MGHIQRQLSVTWGLGTGGVGGSGEVWRGGGGRRWRGRKGVGVVGKSSWFLAAWIGYRGAGGGQGRVG